MNLIDNCYIGKWTYSVGKSNNKNIQIIRCNNSGIQFLFQKVKRLKIDFDEFEQVNIGSFVYSNNN